MARICPPFTLMYGVVLKPLSCKQQCLDKTHSHAQSQGRLNFSCVCSLNHLPCRNECVLVQGQSDVWSVLAKRSLTIDAGSSMPGHLVTFLPCPSKFKPSCLVGEGCATRVSPKLMVAISDQKRGTGLHLLFWPCIHSLLAVKTIALTLTLVEGQTACSTGLRTRVGNKEGTAYLCLILPYPTLPTQPAAPGCRTLPFSKP